MMGVHIYIYIYLYIQASKHSDVCVYVHEYQSAAWGVSTQRQLGFGSGNIPYWENFVSGSWNEVSGGVRSISIGGPQGSVWATDNNGRVWTRNFASPTSPGVGWSQVVSFSTLLSLVDIGGPFGTWYMFTSDEYVSDGQKTHFEHWKSNQNADCR